MSQHASRRSSAPHRANSQVRFADPALPQPSPHRQSLYSVAPNARAPPPSHPAAPYAHQPDPRFSAVPFHGQSRSDDVRRGSDDTLTEIAEEDYKSNDRYGYKAYSEDPDYPAARRSDQRYVGYLGDNDFGYATQRSTSVERRHHPGFHHRSNSRRNSYSGPSSHAQARRDVEADKDNRPGGFFNHVKDAFRQFASDQDFPSRPTTRANSRRNSWAGSARAGPEPRNNFERSLAMNANDEETYLYDDDDHYHNLHLDRGGQAPRREPRELELSRPDFLPDRRKTYSERRKKEKHMIKYCAESMEEYQKFTLTFAKALLAFGSPSHRIEAQLNSLAKVFQIEAQFFHTTGTVQVSFGNPESRSSETCLIKAPVVLALGRIHTVHNIYRAVLHDDMYSSHGTRELHKLLEAKPRYGAKTRLFLSFLCCLLICGVAFGGSLNDMWVAGLMGLLVRALQNLASKSELSASGSEVFTAALVSLIARAFSSFYSRIWCFTAISSSGVISMLPGYLILSGSLDIAGKNPSLGSPKIVSGIMTSLYLGFGLTLGSDVFLFLDRPARKVLAAATTATADPTVLTGTFQAANSSAFADSFAGTFSFTNATSSAIDDVVQGCFRDPSWPWYLQPLPYWTLFLLVPLFALCSSMNSQQHWWSRQMLVMVVIACASFGITRVANLKWGLQDHPDYVSLIGSWIVGILGNGYSRRFGGTAFTSMLTGILLLVPDGLSAAGGLAQNYQQEGQDEYTQSLTLARKMISVIIGIMAGVYSSAAIIYFFGKKKNAALVTF